MMNETEKENRRREVEEELLVASLGGKPVSQDELSLALAYEQGKISKEEFEQAADTAEAVREPIEK